MNFIKTNMHDTTTHASHNPRTESLGRQNFEPPEPSTGRYLPTAKRGNLINFLSRFGPLRETPSPLPPFPLPSPRMQLIKLYNLFC